MKIILGSTVKLSCEPDVKQIIISRDNPGKDGNIDIMTFKEAKVVIPNLGVPSVRFSSEQSRLISIPGSSKPLVKQKESSGKRYKFSDAQREPKHSYWHDDITSNTHQKSSIASNGPSISLKTIREERKKLVLKRFHENIKSLAPSSSKTHQISSCFSLKDSIKNLDLNDDDTEAALLFDPALDYSLNDDGSVTCKICKETVPSRTHWYRHKYKVKCVQELSWLILLNTNAMSFQIFPWKILIL